MALSGVLGQSYTAAEAVTRALKKIGVCGQGVTPSADEMADSLDTLAEMLSSWSTEGPNLWTRAEQTVTLVTGTQTYTLSPRPRLVYNARLAVSGVETLPLTEWDRQDWDKFIYKAGTGLPTMYVQDKQRTATTLTFWPLPTFSSGAYTVVVGYERAIEMTTAGNNDLDIPNEFMEAVVICLAARLAEDYQLVDQNTQRIQARAETLYEQVMGFDRWGDVDMRVIRR